LYLHAEVFSGARLPCYQYYICWKWWKFVLKYCT